ncbi:unnamed protein product, partial [Protopolystoma xenopodis]
RVSVYATSSQSVVIRVAPPRLFAVGGGSGGGGGGGRHADTGSSSTESTSTRTRRCRQLRRRRLVETRLLPLRYRIECSCRADFDAATRHAFIVEPPVSVDFVFSGLADSPDQSRPRTTRQSLDETMKRVSSRRDDDQLELERRQKEDSEEDEEEKEEEEEEEDEEDEEEEGYEEEEEEEVDETEEEEEEEEEKEEEEEEEEEAEEPMSWCWNAPFRVGYYELKGLAPGQAVFVRVFAFSFAGWSEPVSSTPIGLLPSSWHQALLPALAPPRRFMGRTQTSQLDELRAHLEHELANWAGPSGVGVAVGEPVDGESTSEAGGAGGAGDGDAGLVQTRRVHSPVGQRKLSIRSLFVSASVKFTKHTKTGVYLALVCHVRAPTSTSATPTLARQPIVLFDDALPLIRVTRDLPPPTQLAGEVGWLARLLADAGALDLRLVNRALAVAGHAGLPATLQLKARLCVAVQRLQ